jgi:hypothetical protein
MLPILLPRRLGLTNLRRSRFWWGDKSRGRRRWFRHRNGGLRSDHPHDGLKKGEDDRNPAMVETTGTKDGHYPFKRNYS